MIEEARRIGQEPKGRISMKHGLSCFAGKHMNVIFL
jgi:hypothetical protein